MLKVSDKKKQKSRIITIRVIDPELKMFLRYIVETKGNMSEFTRQLWKLTEEWDKFKKLEDKSWLEEK